jgi:uncharacterized protein (TIGR03435 family)
MLRAFLADRLKLVVRTESREFDLKWVPDDVRRAAARPIDGPSFVVALEEQLGLRLENTRTAMEFVVVESVQRPAEN